MEKYKFEFSEEELNLLLEALGNMPWVRVNKLVQRLAKEIQNGQKKPVK